MDEWAGAAIRALRGLIEVQTRALDEDLPGALQEVVERLALVLDVRAVAINLLRPAWDDFEIVAIHAPADVVSALRGEAVPRATIERLLDPAFDVGGAYFIPAGAVDEAELGGPSAVIPRDDRPDHPDRWEEDDEFIVPIRSDGALVGFVSIDEPTSGLRLGRREIGIAVAVADAAGAAVRGAQRALEARASREALELLFELSASLTNDDDVDTVLHTACDGIRRALGFERIVIEIADDASNELRLRATVGWEEGAPAGVTSLEDVEQLCDPAYEIEGCYLWPADQAIARVGLRARRYESRNNGVGPLAWDHHWLIVPLRHPDGRIGGWVWPDDPADHLLPTREKLRILRTFANQALAAVTDAAHVDQLEALARVDELTGVLNRRAFFERLDVEVHRARRTKAPVSVVLYDLDQFKALNDGHGHPAGDAALRTFSRILERNVRASDAVGRVGGDEFALLLAGADANDVARILERITATTESDPPALGVRASYGVARTGEDGWTREELVEAADRRLYDHKRRRHIHVLPPRSASS
ncbi:MAG: diguanylate cyclase [Acidimicrobiales bacterium]